MPDLRTITDRAARVFTLIFLACIAIIAAALVLQHVFNLDPCPWCIVQRIGFIALGLLALIAALHRPRGGGILIYAGLLSLVAIAGASAAGYQIYLQSRPELAAACAGSTVERTLDQLGLGPIIPALFQYDGPCTLKPWSILGFSIPELSFGAFVVLLVIALFTPWWARR